jgi:hypothetical protein
VCSSDLVREVCAACITGSIAGYADNHGGQKNKGK